jgi:phosphomannomutase
MHNCVYLFDVDGTLTPPLSSVTEEFADVFLSWAFDKDVYLVTGSNIEKTSRQLFGSFLDQCNGIFTCSGNVLHRDQRVVYQNTLQLPPGFLDDLQLYLDQGTMWRRKTGEHIEVRQGMVNFSTVGRSASPDLREAYHRWDRVEREREDIVSYITNLYPQFEASIGGQISVDIYPRGKNKAQVVPVLEAEHGKDVRLIFVGDRNLPGGNDWPLAQALDKREGCHWFQVKSPHETQVLIEHSTLFI